MQHERQFISRQISDRGKILDRVVRNLGEQAGNDHVGGSDQDNGLAVGRRTDQRLRTDHRIAATAVVDKHLLTKTFRQFRRVKARLYVQTASRRVGNNQSDRFTGIRLLPQCRSGDGDQRTEYGCPRRKDTTLHHESSLDRGRRPVLRYPASASNATRELVECLKICLRRVMQLSIVISGLTSQCKKTGRTFRALSTTIIPENRRRLYTSRTVNANS